MSKKKPLTKEQLKQKLQRFVPVLKKTGKAVALYAVIKFCAPSQKAQAQTYNLAENPPVTTNTTTGDYPKTKTMYVQYDTMADGEKRGFANYRSAINVITINHSRTDKEFNEHSHAIEVAIHENKHRKDALNGVHDYPTSLEQTYKIDVHGEKAACMEALVYKRNEYLRTGDINVFDGFFSYYRDEILAGHINPFSNNIEDFEKEMAAIVDLTNIQWQKNYDHLESYHRQHINHVEIFADKSEKYSNFHDINYQRALNKIYTIGGINFRAYMGKYIPTKEEDVEIPPADQEILDGIRRNTPKELKSSKNEPINRSKISRVAKYRVWSERERVSPPQEIRYSEIIIQTPPGYKQEISPKYAIWEEEISQDENVTQNIQTKESKKKTFKERWSDFREGVKKFFQPIKYENPYRQQQQQKTATVQQPAPKTTPSQTTAKPAPTGQTSKPAPSTTVTKTVQNTPSTNTQKTISQQDQSTSRISPTKKKTTKIKINKLRTAKNKQTAPSSSYISPRDKRDMKAMKKNVSKYAKAKSANNNQI